MSLVVFHYEGNAEVVLQLKPSYFQSGRSLHGAIFFKVRDEAACFAEAEAEAYNDKGKDVARGSGIFLRSRLPFNEALGYGD